MDRVRRNAEIARRYQLGETQAELALAFGVGIWSVRKALDEHGAFLTPEQAAARSLAGRTSPAARAKAAASNRRPLSERFRAKHVVDENGCWVWLGSTDRRGYGQIRCESGLRYATHVSLELVGKPRPNAGSFALHRCDNPPCVNPDHLWWGTARDNTRDMVAKGRNDFSGLEAGRNRADNRPTVLCANCGSAFRTTAYRAKQNKRNFCNKECCAAWQSLNFTGAKRGETNGIDPRVDKSDPLWGEA